MSSEIKYTSSINTEINGVKKTGSTLLSGTTKINALATTTLPGAKEFIREQNDIYKLLKTLANVATLDANDALEMYVDFEKTDKEIGDKIKASWGARTPEE